MKTYYKYKGKLVDLEKHFNCDSSLFKVVRKNCNDIGRLVIRKAFEKTRYISMDKVVLESELTEEQKKLIK